MIAKSVESVVERIVITDDLIKKIQEIRRSSCVKKWWLNIGGWMFALYITTIVLCLIQGVYGDHQAASNTAGDIANNSSTIKLIVYFVLGKLVMAVFFTVIMLKEQKKRHKLTEFWEMASGVLINAGRTEQQLHYYRDIEFIDSNSHKLLLNRREKEKNEGLQELSLKEILRAIGV